MAYVCEFGAGQKVYLDNQGTQTRITTYSGSPGQQQQSSSSFPTGDWTAPPEAFASAQGVTLKINTSQGAHYIQIQGGSMQVVSAQAAGGAQQMQMHTASMPSTPAMQPMQPMQPMRMGDMEMNAGQPMQMRMGNMQMRMGESPQSAPPSTTPQAGRRFCSQCGAAVEPTDRFCASCGHQLQK